MKKKLSVLMVCGLLILSGCYGNNNPSGTERDKEITSKSETEEVTATESTTTVTTTAEKSISVSETTKAADLTCSEPIFYSETAYPDVLTLRVPNEKQNVSYEVKSEGLPEDIANTIVSEIKDPPDNFVMLARDDDGNYRLVDRDKSYHDRYLDGKTDEETLSLFPENVYIGVSIWRDSVIFGQETVIKEGLNRIFTRTENNKKMYEAIDAAKDSDEVLYIYTMIICGGTYNITVCADSYFQEYYWLGASGPLNDDPDMLVRTVFEYGNPCIEFNVTNDEPYEMSLEAVAAGYCEYPLIFRAIDVENDTRIKDVMFGDAVKLTDMYVMDIRELKLSFRIKEQSGDITRFYICQLNEETNEFERVDTFYDKEKGELYTYTVPCGTLEPESERFVVLGTYCLCDKEALNWELDGFVKPESWHELYTFDESKEHFDEISDNELSGSAEQTVIVLMNRNIIAFGIGTGGIFDFERDDTFPVVKVKCPYFDSLSSIKSFLDSTYTAEEAEKLMNRGSDGELYLTEKNGEMYANSMYAITWNSDPFEHRTYIEVVDSDYDKISFYWHYIDRELFDYNNEDTDVWIPHHRKMLLYAVNENGEWRLPMMIFDNYEFEKKAAEKVKEFFEN